MRCHRGDHLRPFSGTRLEPLAAEIAWGFVNSFHFVASKLEKREDTLTNEIRSLARRPDLSEVYNRELEEKQLLCQSTTEQRDAVECMRDYAAEMYRAQSGWPWSPAKGSRVSSASTATQIAVQDFLRERALEKRERFVPQGPIVVASGHAEWHDWQQVWARLDVIHERIPHMMLVSTAQRKASTPLSRHGRPITTCRWSPTRWLAQGEPLPLPATASWSISNRSKPCSVRVRHSGQPLSGAA
jgi:hypothetical protein